MALSKAVYKAVRSFFDLRKPPSEAPSRILIHGMNYAPEFIGVGKYTTELAEFLVARHHSVEVVAALPHYPGWVVRADHPWRYQRQRQHGVEITRCPLLARRNGRGIWRLIAPVSFAALSAPLVIWRSLRTRPDVVLSVEPALASAPAALLAAWLGGARAVLHVQDLEVDAAFATGHLRHRLLQRAAHSVERLLLRGFDQVITISDSMAARLRDRGVRADRLSVVRNWVHGAKLQPVLPMHFLRQSLGIPSDAKVVLYAGHLGAKQGLGVLIEAARLSRSDPRLRFVIAGDGPMLAMMRASAADLPAVSIIGLQPPEVLGDLLAMADVHVLPQDPAAGDLVFPSKLGALLVSGRPIVVTADAGTELASWLDGAATVVPAGDARALTEAIRRDVQKTAWSETARAQTLAATLEASAVLHRFEDTMLRQRHGWSANLVHDGLTISPPVWLRPADEAELPQSA